MASSSAVVTSARMPREAVPEGFDGVGDGGQPGAGLEMIEGPHGVDQGVLGGASPCCPVLAPTVR